MSWDSIADAQEKLAKKNLAAWDGYLGFYSSWLGGYFREPWAMSVPVDDHGFHRGDGVFEAVRIHDKAYIDFKPHMDRLFSSASQIGIEPPADVAERCLELGRRCDADRGILRLYVTRGPGSFSPNPRESVGAQVYAAITRMKPPSDESYQKGCKALISRVPAKEPFFARIKSLNYLQNVLVKTEVVEKNCDLAICLNTRGTVCEGATENVLIVAEDGRVLVPKFDYTLPGTTVRTVMDIARAHGDVPGVEFADLGREDLKFAREIAFVGTTLGVLPVGRLDERDVPVGPICRDLHREYMKRIGEDASLRTPF